MISGDQIMGTLSLYFLSNAVRVRKHLGQSRVCNAVYGICVLFAVWVDYIPGLTL